MKEIPVNEIANQMSVYAIHWLEERNFPNDAPHAFVALTSTADRHGMILMNEGDSHRTYQLPDGRLINLRTKGPLTRGIGEGGAGFDDKVVASQNTA